MDITMKEKTCQENIRTCAYWKSTMPDCPFNPIYREENNKEEIIFRFPTVKISPPEWTTARRPLLITTYSGRTKRPEHPDADITTSWEHVSKSRVNVENSMESTTAAYVTTSSEQMSTHRVNRKKSTDINTGTQPKTGTSTSNPITLTSTALTEYGVTRQLDTHDSTGDTVVLSFAVGLFSFLVGMLVMLLLYRGNKSRMKFARKRQDRRISVFLINNARQYTSRENLNAELPIRYQSIQSLNTPNAQIPNTYQNSEEAGIPYLNSDRDDIQTVSSNICRQEISSVFGTTLNQEDCNSGEYMELNDI
ncbi:uncharacterized protein LOC125655922 isoform X1 [Ostrea edulis]|uniref:uncharacterized protein LOC125655922 isoform X1 n=1 Tax=Ostrea edulis TaxID=37623 RepID=UPI002094BA9B|nr:uncharacterized protein LOC125655922 isoform X1 [Ostrea edulis]XP_056001508.1 uncharacterized protein LOC125655922 isoform X1 [Ostrea edulis]XP_056001509.1 uncharacterized protein LOC125655922 isoform X1 [Ostrea edulis]